MCYFMVDWVQYCVKLRKGSDAGLSHYVVVSEEQIKKVFGKIKNGCSSATQINNKVAFC